MSKHTIAKVPTHVPLTPLAVRRFVLVVDDEPPVLALTMAILAKDNYEILGAASGREALEQVQRLGRNPDLLVSDYMMPEMNGRELAARLLIRNPGIRVLFQTGYADRLFGERELLEEHTAFLEKPFSSRGLREAARLSLFGAIRSEPARA